MWNHRCGWPTVKLPWIFQCVVVWHPWLFSCLRVKCNSSLNVWWSSPEKPSALVLNSISCYKSMQFSVSSWVSFGSFYFSRNSLLWLHTLLSFGSAVSSLSFMSKYFLFFFSIFFLICSEFCHTIKWNSHGFTCVPHPNPPSHLPLHPVFSNLPYNLLFDPLA